MRRWLSLIMLLPVVLAAGSSLDPGSLSRQADAAFQSGDAAKAAELYDRASLRTPLPAQLAFNLATARYRQAREGQLTVLGEAEVNYCACLDHADYRARCLYGLGNCLLLRAETGASLDRVLLKSALDRYAECLKDPGCDDSLAAHARYNRSRARLLLLQTPPTAEPPPTDGEDSKDDASSQQKDDKSAVGDPDKEKLRPSQGGAKDKSKEGGPAETKDGKHEAGKGMATVPPSDDRDAPPIARQDAERHLELATKRILEESVRHRRSKSRPPAAGGKDW